MDKSLREAIEAVNNEISYDNCETKENVGISRSYGVLDFKFSHI